MLSSNPPETDSVDSERGVETRDETETVHRITAVMAKKETVAKLIKQRWELTNVTPFGYYLHCAAKDFALENKDCTFEDHHIPLVEDMWRSLTEERKIPYIEAAKRRNDAQQMERQKIDRKIIQLRPGARDYRGYEITPLPSNVLEKDKVIANKRGLNPVSWYHWSEHEKNVKNPKYNWKDYYLGITIETNSTWPSLTEEKKNTFIHRAKVEYRRFTGSNEGNEVIDSILKKSLEQHARCGFGK